MSDFIKYQENTFNRFYGKTAKNFVRNEMEAMLKKKSREVNYEFLADIEDQIPAHYDSYCFYEQTYYVKDIPIVVRDELLADCLQYIVPNRRNVILLSFFGGYNKSRIAEILHISNPTVAYRLDVGMKEMKELILRRNACEKKGSL